MEEPGTGNMGATSAPETLVKSDFLICNSLLLLSRSTPTIVKHVCLKTHRKWNETGATERRRPNANTPLRPLLSVICVTTLSSMRDGTAMPDRQHAVELIILAHLPGLLP